MAFSDRPIVKHWRRLVKNDGGKPKYWGRSKVGNDWWKHRRFLIIRGVTCPGCPGSLHLCCEGF